MKMACFRKIFCMKKKRPKEPSVDRIVAGLECTEALLLKQQEDLEKQINECIGNAKKLATSHKRMALRALQKKKRLEKTLEQVDHTLITLEQQRDALENAKTNAIILGSMKNAGKALKKANLKLNNDQVQKVMDSIQEQHFVGGEISTAIRKSLVMEYDEDELAKELQELRNVPGESRNILQFPSIPQELDEVFDRKNEEHFEITEVHLQKEQQEKT